MPTSQENIDDILHREYVIVRLSKSNLTDLAMLYTAVYDISLPADYFIKKYDTIYTGVEFVGFIAYNHDGIPVAYYGVIPCFIVNGNSSVLAAQSVDTMTHPQYRYKGLFVELSNMVFDLCREIGIQLIFGFPNQNFYAAIANKSIWKTLHTMDYFAIPVSGIPLESLFRRIAVLKSIYQWYRRFIFRKYLLSLNGIKNSVLSDGFAGVDRDDGYLYNKTYNSSKVIKVYESKVWIEGEAGLVIGDMEGINKMNFNPVIAHLKRIARRLGVRKIYFHCSPGTELHQLFLSNYEPRPSFPVIFQDFGSTIPSEKIKFTFADIDIF